MTWRDRWEALRESEESRAYVVAEEAKHALAANVYRRRKKLRLSQTTLAKLVGTKQPNISEIEAADSNVTLETLGKLAAALGLATVAELFAAPDASGRDDAMGGTHSESGPRRLDTAIYIAKGFAGFDVTQGLVFRSETAVDLAQASHSGTSGREWS